MGSDLYQWDLRHSGDQTVTSKNECSDYRVTVYADTVENVIAKLSAAVAEVDR